MSWVTALARPEIVSLSGYESAGWEPGLTRLHANELPWRSAVDESVAGLNRYPEPQPRDLIARLAHLYRVPPASVLACRGSDEAIDLLVRAFCRAGEDAILICPPTFGMYAMAARVQGAQLVSVPLQASAGFALDPQAVLQRCAPNVKIVFLCSPNNPTGNMLDGREILTLLEALEGRALVVVDEAYIEFAGVGSLARFLAKHPHLAVLRTLSKSHGLAGARCGSLLADPGIVALLRKIMPPYPITQLTIEAVLRLLSASELRIRSQRVGELRLERQRLENALIQLPVVRQVFPSESNFILARFTDAGAALERARSAGLLVRDARSYEALPDALRITVGLREQNDRLLKAWA